MSKKQKKKRIIRNLYIINIIIVILLGSSYWYLSHRPFKGSLNEGKSYIKSEQYSVVDQEVITKDDNVQRTVVLTSEELGAVQKIYETINKKGNNMMSLFSQYQSNLLSLQDFQDEIFLQMHQMTDEYSVLDTEINNDFIMEVANLYELYKSLSEDMLRYANKNDSKALINIGKANSELICIKKEIEKLNEKIN